MCGLLSISESVAPLSFESCRQPDQLNGSRRDHLAECTPMQTFDYFSGSEWSYALSFFFLFATFFGTYCLVHHATLQHLCFNFEVADYSKSASQCGVAICLQCSSACCSFRPSSTDCELNGRERRARSSNSSVTATPATPSVSQQHKLAYFVSTLPPQPRLTGNRIVH